jgi:hypothetical protein
MPRLASRIVPLTRAQYAWPASSYVHGLSGTLLASHGLASRCLRRRGAERLHLPHLNSVLVAGKP